MAQSGRQAAIRPTDGPIGPHCDYHHVDKKRERERGRMTRVVKEILQKLFCIFCQRPAQLLQNSPKVIVLFTAFRLAPLSEPFTRATFSTLSPLLLLLLLLPSFPLRCVALRCVAFGGDATRPSSLLKCGSGSCVISARGNSMVPKECTMQSQGAESF